MRNIILAALAAAAIMPVAANAQSYGDSRQDQRDPRAAQVDGDHRDGRDGRDGRDARQPVRDDGNGDWHDYRRAHPEAFRHGGYRGPNGFRYRPVSVGYRFQPGYYGRNYWVNDWRNYRLPRPLGYQRWVRYGNDVVLVDIRSGTVVSVYNGFFY